jgi:hypothetical protein
MSASQAEHEGSIPFTCSSRKPAESLENQDFRRVSLLRSALMDIQKTGQLIAQDRKAQGLTQRALADRLHWLQTDDLTSRLASPHV